jgi:anti-sigma B factor antagonist
MSVTILAPGPQMRARVAGDLTIAEAAETRDALALCLSTSETLELELDAIENIDIAGLQLLIALMKEPKSVRLRKPSPALAHVVELLQIDSLQLSPAHP